MSERDLDADLTAYYSAEVAAGTRNDQGDFRRALRTGFAERLLAASSAPASELRLLDVGAGPGLDTELWLADGFAATGVDLVVDHARAMRARAIDAVAASLYALPFARHHFDALWTMSTFVHVPHARFDEAMSELTSVVRPGGLLGIGTWGGPDFEGHPEFGSLRPYRFFSLAGHHRWRSMLARHGTVESFDTHVPETHHEWEYQFAVVRTPS